MYALDRKYNYKIATYQEIQSHPYIYSTKYVTAKWSKGGGIVLVKQGDRDK